MIVKDAGINRPSPAPISAASGPSVATDTTWRVDSTASAATSTHRTTSAVSITVRAPIRSVSIPASGITTVRGTP